MVLQEEISKSPLKSIRYTVWDNTASTKSEPIYPVDVESISLDKCENFNMLVVLNKKSGDY